MNEQVAAVLDKLATKLGTTTEYLWGVLVNQAPIEGTVAIIQFAILGVLWVAAHKLVSNWKRLWAMAYENDLEPVMILAAVVLFVGIGAITLAGFFSLPLIVSAFLNPEYWALQKVMSAIGK